MTELDVVDALRTGAVARFAGSSLIDANLLSADLRGVELSHVDLRMANLRAADLSGATLDHVDLAGADLSGGVLRRCRIEFSDLSHAVLVGADLMGATLRDCRCDAAVFVEAQLRDATLSGSRFDGANFDGALMVGMRSIDSSYRHARLTTARQFALVREVIAAVLAESAGDDPARISLAAMVASLRGWCWDTWAREQRTLVPHVWAWAAEVLRGCRESGLLDRTARRGRQHLAASRGGTVTDRARRSVRDAADGQSHIRPAPPARPGRPCPVGDSWPTACRHYPRLRRGSSGRPCAASRDRGSVRGRPRRRNTRGARSSRRPARRVLGAPLTWPRSMRRIPP